MISVNLSVYANIAPWSHKASRFFRFQELNDLGKDTRSYELYLKYF
jgi:hypothetical protein